MKAHRSHETHRRLRRCGGWAMVVLLATAPGPGASAAAHTGAHAAAEAAPAALWRWPVAGGFRLVEPYAAPARPFGPGHRGVDVEPAADAVIVAPADGSIAFTGRVADRPVVTIAHADGLVTTLEPVEALWPVGTSLSRGEPVATLATGGHTAEGALHIGVRRDGEYISPSALLGGVPRAVLLPCC